MNKIRNEKWEATIDPTGIPRIVKRLLWTIVCQKNANVEEMDKFLERNHKEIENLNRPLTSAEIETD